MPINEFAKMNNDFRKFKDKRKQSMLSNSKGSEIAKVSSDQSITRNILQNSKPDVKHYTTNPTKRSEGLTVDQSNSSTSILLKSGQKTSIENQKTAFITSHATHAINLDKGSMSDVLRSYGNNEFNKTGRIEEDDEVNYAMSEEDPLLDRSEAPNPMKVNHTGKVRRNRGMRVDKNQPRNYYRRPDQSNVDLSINQADS